MLKIKNITVLLVFASVFYGCKKDHWNDLFKPTGANEIRIREISGFNKITLYDKIDVYLTQGPVFEVKVEAGKNLHIGIITEVQRDSTLVIKNENKCNFIRSQTKKINVHITAPHFYFLTNKGVGSFFCNNQLIEDTIGVYLESSGDVHLNINAKKLKTSSHGNGDVYVRGITNESFNYLNGTNILNMKECTVMNYMYVTSISVCHAHVKAPENGGFEGSISSKGNIYYTGNPLPPVFKIADKGELIKE